MRLDEALRVSGVTYRQLDYWIRTGRINIDQPLPGSGCRRDYPATEMAIAARMRKLLDGGLSLAAATQVARDFEEPYKPERITAGVYVYLTELAS